MDSRNPADFRKPTHSFDLPYSFYHERTKTADPSSSLKTDSIKKDKDVIVTEALGRINPNKFIATNDSGKLPQTSASNAEKNAAAAAPAVDYDKEKDEAFDDFYIANDHGADNNDLNYNSENEHNKRPPQMESLLNSDETPIECVAVWWVEGIQLVCNIWFALEVSLKLVASPDKMAFLSAPINLIDLASTAVYCTEKVYFLILTFD